MFYLSGLLLLSLDASMICGQTTRDNGTAFEDESIRVKNESVQPEQDTLFSPEGLNVTQERNDFPIHGPCNEEELKIYGGGCWEIFNHIMSNLGQENWCNMEMVIRDYHKLTECMELVCSFLGCFYPNPVMEKLFVDIHQQYFSHCSNEKDLPDAPAEVVLVSTLLPIFLIPFLVYIVVWKSSLRD